MQSCSHFHACNLGLTVINARLMQDVQVIIEKEIRLSPSRVILNK